MPKENFIYDLRTLVKDIIDSIGYDKLYSDINPNYHNAPKNFSLSNIEVVTTYVNIYLGKQSKQLIVKFDKDSKNNIYGFYVNLNDTICYIILNPNLNSCWKRFALLKELCSVYLNLNDNGEHKTNKFDNYLDSLKNAYDQKKVYIEKEAFRGDEVDDETYAILLATELMLPFKHRNILKDLLKKVDQNVLSLNDVAKSLMIPEYVLKLYLDNGLLNENPSYEDFPK